MNVARVVVLAVAVGAGLVATILAMNLTSSSPEPTTAEAPQTTKTSEILVASKAIQIGSKIDAGLVTWRTWPEDGLTSTYITKTGRPGAVTELTGTIARGSFFPGEPITEAKVAHTDSGFVSAILPSGMRAVAIPVSASTSAGGFILPNDRVDVIMTRKLTTSGSVGPSEERIIPETILTNVRVLAIDQSVMDKKLNDDKSALVGQTATLELTQEQAETITVAQRMNDKLTLALRSLADADAGTTATPRSNQRSGVVVVRRGVSQEVDTNR